MDPITPLSKQELENRGWQMTTVENPTPDPGPTVVQQMRLEFATIKAYKGSEGRSRTLRFKLFGVAEADLPNIRLEFGRFIKTRHTAASGLAPKGDAPSSEYAANNDHYQCKGFIVPNPKRRHGSEFNPGTRTYPYGGYALGRPFMVPQDGFIATGVSDTWRKPLMFLDGSTALISRTRLQPSVNNTGLFNAVDPNPDITFERATGSPDADTVLTLTDFLAGFVSLFDAGTITFIGSHRSGSASPVSIQSTPEVEDPLRTLATLRLPKCGFRLINIVTNETSPILEFVPVVQLSYTKSGWAVVAHVSYGSYNPKRHLVAKSFNKWL